MTNDRINEKDESIILGFTAWKTKEEVPLPLAFKLGSEGQQKPWGDLIIFFFFFKREKRTNLEKATAVLQDWTHTAQTTVCYFTDFWAHSNPYWFQEKNDWIHILFSVSTCGTHSFLQSWKHAQDCLIQGTSLFLFFFFLLVLSSLNPLSTVHYHSTSLTEKG